MKRLKKISLDGFNELSTRQTAQLFGGQDPLRTDSTTVRTDSTTIKIPTPVTHKISGSSTYNTKNGSTTYSVGYTGSSGNWSWGASGNYNPTSGTSLIFKVDYTIGGGKK